MSIPSAPHQTGKLQSAPQHPTKAEPPARGRGIATGPRRGRHLPGRTAPSDRWCCCGHPLVPNPHCPPPPPPASVVPNGHAAGAWLTALHAAPPPHCTVPYAPPPPSVRSQEHDPADAHTGARVGAGAGKPPHRLGVSGCTWSTARATAPSLGRPTPGVVKQDKSSGGSGDTTTTRSDPQRVGMCSGNRCLPLWQHPPPPPSRHLATIVVVRSPCQESTKILRGGVPPPGPPPPLLPFQCLRLTAKILRRRLRCPEGLSFKLQNFMAGLRRGR